MPFEIDDTLQEVEGSGTGGVFKYCHRGGTVNTSGVILSILITAINPNTVIELEISVKKPGKSEEERVSQPARDPVTNIVSDKPLKFVELGKYEIPIRSHISTADVCYALKIIGTATAKLSSNLESLK